jgi:arylsulfatase A-like enzyme
MVTGSGTELTRLGMPGKYGWAADAGAVMSAWAALVGVEALRVATVDRSLLAGSWEVAQARRLVAPIAVAMLAPLAVLAGFTGRLVVRAARDGSARAMVATSLASAFAALGYGVSFGPHMRPLSVRIPFVALLGLIGGAAGYAAPRLVARLPRGALASAGAVSAVAAWWADARVLPRLYPAFHLGLLVLLLAGAAVAATALVRPLPRAAGPPPARSFEGSVGHVGVLVAAFACIAWVPGAARRLRLADNLRLVLEERTVLLRRAVELAALVAPPPPLDDATSQRGGSPDVGVGEIPRALDWSGHDVLLVSVDALRADHVSSYGYRRSTTPSLDALAREGALFESAYCPTPHTSYSVTSLMTGKAMRPLMALGLGGGSETWATQLRRYGYRTAAFYPPAVFYIDADRFGAFEESRLDFEYAKVQFSTAEERVREVARYLEEAPPTPVFLWVHLFEPHEPYVMHPSHPFGGSDPKAVDAYDSEIAYADSAIGKLVAEVRAKRPGAVVIVTADHGEEFGEHGGRYHGTTCYEEQVRVPLVVVGPGVPARRVPSVVQTIDLLPTVLSALGVPRPARVRGRDLGPLLGGGAAAPDPGLAYAETDDYALVARGMDRLICARRVSACALYDVSLDPGEKADLAATRPETTRELRGLLAGIEREAGHFEAGAAPWPDPIRRGLLRDGDAAQDAAALLDDASAPIRRKAAEVMFLLHVPSLAPETRRALARDEDREVQDWCALALVRMGERPSTTAESLLLATDPVWRRRAAIAFASQGDGRGAGELAAYWREQAPPHGGLDVEDAKELLTAIGRIRAVEAVPALVESLPFVPLRPFIADTLGAIGGVRARGPLLRLFEGERYETARAHEARALLALGVRRELYAPLVRFAGMPEPMIDAIAIARNAKLLEPATGGLSLERPQVDLETRLTLPSDPLAGHAHPQSWRLLVLGAGEGGDKTGEWDELSGSVEDRPLGSGADAGQVHIRELGDGFNGAKEQSGGAIAVRLHEPHGILAVWVVSRAQSAEPF